VRDLY